MVWFRRSGTNCVLPECIRFLVETLVLLLELSKVLPLQIAIESEHWCHAPTGLDNLRDVYPPLQAGLLHYGLTALRAL